MYARPTSRRSPEMVRLLATFLVFWEPLHFAAEALGVLPTIAYRGPLAVFELCLHGVVAALSAAAGFALFNGAPDGRPLAIVAVVAIAARTIQSVYFSVLPDNTAPGAEPVYLIVAVALAIAAVAGLRRVPR